MIASAHGSPTDVGDLRQQFSVSLKGLNLQQLMAHASALMFDTRPVRLELDELQFLRLPCILHWDLNHFVVLTKVTRRRITIIDPAVGERRLVLSVVSRHFTGVAVELLPNARFEAALQSRRLKLSSLTGRVTGLGRSLCQLFGIALVLELFAITSPLLNQLIVDEALTSHDQDLLGVIVLGFATLLVVQASIGFARGWMVMCLGQSLGLQWASNVFSHLLKLPLEFFERRHLGDIVSRFSAVGSIQRTLTISAVEAVMDGLMAVAALGMMLMYSGALTAIVVVAVIAYALLRIASYRPYREAAQERLTMAAKESTHFLETLRAIVPIKLFGQQSQRVARWQNLLVNVQNRDVRTARMNILFSAANTLIFGLENLVVFWFGALVVMQTRTLEQPVFTVGMLFAFISYKTQFTGRVSALVDYAVEIKMIGLHAERLADIALHKPELDLVCHSELSNLHPRIELRNVSFRYGDSEPWVLRGVNLVVEPCESVAIVGRSGGGKSTLLKILLGLLEPAEGEVRYGGVPVKQLGVQNYRRLVGTVMQDDSLLSGTISENVCFFDVRPVDEHIQACARLAGIHDEIVEMPMGYQTLVGDLGSSLSGGQKQRVLLARALYKRPRVLALDEATSHLDVANEQQVTRALANVKVTRIVVAHRPETIATAERVIRVEEGGVCESRFRALTNK